MSKRKERAGRITDSRTCAKSYARIRAFIASRIQSMDRKRIRKLNNEINKRKT